MKTQINKKIARKVLEVIDKGLVKGLGKPVPGQMCVEAAVNYAMGLPHGDSPQCVGRSVRDFKIDLNDSYWSSDEARTKGLRKLAIAQLGSDTLDQKEFTEKLGYRCMTTVLPLIVENALKEDAENQFVKKNVDSEQLKIVVSKLKKSTSFEEAKSLTRQINDIYSVSAYVSTYVSAPASAYAHAHTSTSGSTSGYTSGYVSIYVSAYALRNPRFTDKILNLTAKAGLDTLIEMKSPGVKWLDICE